MITVKTPVCQPKKRPPRSGNLTDQSYAPLLYESLAPTALSQASAINACPAGEG